jgi:hypothetical protein
VLAETEESRSNFADNVLKFLVFYGFDGVRQMTIRAKNQKKLISSSSLIRLMDLITLMASDRCRLGVSSAGECALTN